MSFISRWSYRIDSAVGKRGAGGYRCLAANQTLKAMNNGLRQDGKHSQCATGEDGRQSKPSHPGQSSQAVINWLF